MHDPKPPMSPDDRSSSVRTPSMVPSCPISGRPLTGNQTVCSGKCRIERSRRRRDAKHRARTAKVQLLLNEALRVFAEEGEQA